MWCMPDHVFQETAFLPLDDIILEGKHIDIGSTSSRSRNRRRSSIASSSGFYGRGHGQGEDGGAGGGLPGGGDVPDITRPPMFLMEQDYGNSFKMSTCAPQQLVGQRTWQVVVSRHTHTASCSCFLDLYSGGSLCETLTFGSILPKYRMALVNNVLGICCCRFGTEGPRHRSPSRYLGRTHPSGH